MNEITKEQFESYRNVQMSGQYNMVMDMAKAMKAAGLTKKQYFDIINHYNELAKKFGYSD